MSVRPGIYVIVHFLVFGSGADKGTADAGGLLVTA